MSTKNPISSIFENLEKNGNAIHLEPIDTLWDIPNLFVNSIEELLLILVKTSSIPLIPDYTKPEIYTKVGITLKQAKFIQETNQTLLQLQTYIEKYCVQQYTLASYIKKNMDEIVLDIHEIPEMDGAKMLKFIEGLSQQDTIQMGGKVPMNRLIPFFLKIIFLLLIVLPSGFSEISNKPQSLTDSKLVSRQDGMISLSADQLVKGLFEQPEIRSGPVDFNPIVVRLNKQIEEQTAGIIGSVLSFFNHPEDGQRVLQKVIESFNTDSRQFSRSAEESCFELMKMAKDNGVFKEWRDMDSLKETSDKLQNLSTAVEKQNANIQSNMYNNTVGAFVSGVASPLTGDFATPVTYIAQLGGNLWDYLGSTQNAIKQTKELVAQQPVNNTVISETEKKQLETNLFTFSKLYCSFGYNLQLELNGTTVSVIGDKIEYLSMIELIDTLETNLKFQITKVSVLDGDEKSKQLTLNILESLNQRLGVLKAITDSLYNIVNFSFKIAMLKLTRFPAPNNMDEFKTFLTSQIDSLNKMLVSLNKQFPKRSSALELQKIQIEEDIELKSFEEDINDMEQNATSIARQRSSDRKTKELGDWWIATRTVAQSWVDVGTNATDFGKQSLGKSIQSIADFGAEAPLALVRSVLHFANNILFELFTSPAGWAIIIGGLLTISFMFGGIRGTITIFKNGGELFLAISWGGILFVYKLINTPFGYIYRQIATMYVNTPAITDSITEAPLTSRDPGRRSPRIESQDDINLAKQAENYANFENNKEEGEEYDPNLNYPSRGGKSKGKSKGRKTRKNKKKKTRKLRVGKRRQTKHNRVRPTKKH